MGTAERYGCPAILLIRAACAGLALVLAHAPHVNSADALSILVASVRNTGNPWLLDPNVETDLRYQTDRLAQRCTMHFQQGEFEQVKEIQSQIVAIAERIAGADYWETVRARSRLNELSRPCKLSRSDREAFLAASDRAGVGARRLTTGDLDGAERILKESYEQLVRLAGENSVVATKATQSLGMVYLEKEDGENAKRFYEKALKAQKALAGDDWPDYVDGQGMLAAAFATAGEWDRAESLLRQVTDKFANRADKSSQLYLGHLHNLARVLRMRGKLSDAESRCVEEIIIHDRLGEGDSVSASRFYRQYAEVLIARGEYSLAEAPLRHALSLDEATLVSDHPRIAELAERHGWFLRQLKRPEEAEKAEARAKAIRAEFAERVKRDREAEKRKSPKE
jgi:tetratricopeptide (TPR) repeat protein